MQQDRSVCTDHTHMQSVLERNDGILAEVSSRYSLTSISQFYTNLTVFISINITSRNMYTIIGDSSTLRNSGLQRQRVDA